MKSTYSGWSKRATRGNSGECEGRRSHWEDGKAQDFANNTEGIAVEGKDRTILTEGKKEQRRTEEPCETRKKTPADRRV